MLAARNDFLLLFPNCTGSPLYVTPQLLKGNAENTTIHSAIWKFYLVVAPQSKDRFARSDDWIRILKEMRERFYKLKSEYFIKPPDDDADPLSATTPQDTKWGQYFSDQDLRQQIARDTSRTFQEMEFFQLPETLRTLEDIIFLFCRTHPDYGYPQGIHELAALVLYVFHNEMIAEETDTLSFIFNQTAVIPDAYWTFAGLAEAMKPLYEASNDGDSFCTLTAQKIQRDLVARHSPELAASLASNGIEPQSYMLHWLRLLFMRAFEMKDVINIWDIIIAHLPKLDVVENMCVAMLLEYKDTLITDDAVTALNCLYRYQAPPHPMRLVYRAVDLCSAGENRRPKDVPGLIAERLNELARGLESVCLAKGVEDAVPYIMDLRRARDILLGVLDVDEMLPLEQAVELFKPASVEVAAVPEEPEEKPEDKGEPEIEMPKASTSKVSTSLLFDEEVSPPKKSKKRQLFSKNAKADLFS